MAKTASYINLHPKSYVTKIVRSLEDFKHLSLDQLIAILKWQIIHLNFKE